MCHTTASADTARYRCTGNTSATVRVYEVPWADVPPVPRDCFCSSEASNMTAGAAPPATLPPLMPYTYVSTSQVVEIRFEVTHMNATDDYDSLFFEGFVRFVRMPLCAKNTRRMGPSGEIVFEGRERTQDQVRYHNIYNMDENNVNEGCGESSALSPNINLRRFNALIV